jgi:parallel beta-helix repeat protein
MPITALVGMASFAGPLDPPASPVSTAGPEPRIEINATNTPGDDNSLFRITEPGSYYLASSVSGETAKHGIEIASDNVTIDLMGFEVRGGPGSFSGVTIDGLVPTSLQGISVRNGTASGWGIDGFDLNLSIGAVLQNLQSHDNGRNGIWAGNSSTVENCTASTNGQSGIETRGLSTVRNCTTRSNESGFSVGDLSVVQGCTAGLHTFTGFFGSARSLFSQCTSTNNTGGGFRTESRGVFVECVSTGTQGDGIASGAGGFIDRCTVMSSGSIGISAGSDSVVSQCRVLSGLDDAINVGANSTVSQCVATDNNGDGIQLSAGSTAINNTCTDNGDGVTLGAGIRVTGTGNVVESNTLRANRLGITVPGMSNIIIRNRCQDNTVLNFDIGINNYYGPVIDRVGVSTGFASGNSALGTLTTTDPNANFAY